MMLAAREVGQVGTVGRAAGIAGMITGIMLRCGTRWDGAGCGGHQRLTIVRSGMGED